MVVVSRSRNLRQRSFVVPKRGAKNTTNSRERFSSSDFENGVSAGYQKALLQFASFLLVVVCAWSAAGLMAVDFATIVPSALSPYLLSFKHPLVISGNAGLASAGPLAHLVGVLLVRDYKVFNPLRGGQTFVYLQTAGWTAYTVGVSFLIVDMVQKICSITALCSARLCISCAPGYLIAVALALVVGNSLILSSLYAMEGREDENLESSSTPVKFSRSLSPPKRKYIPLVGATGKCDKRGIRVMKKEKRTNNDRAMLAFDCFTIVVGVCAIVFVVLKAHPDIDITLGENDYMFGDGDGKVELPFCEVPYQFSEYISQLPSALLHLPYIPSLILLLRYSGFLSNKKVTWSSEQFQVVIGLFIFQLWTSLGHIVPNPRVLFIQEASIVLAMFVLRAFINSFTPITEYKIGLAPFVKVIVFMLSSYCAFGLMPTIVPAMCAVGLYTALLGIYGKCVNASTMLKSKEAIQSQPRSPPRMQRRYSLRNIVGDSGVIPELTKVGRIAVGMALAFAVFLLVAEVHLCPYLLQYNADWSWHAPFDFYFWQVFWVFVQFVCLSKPGSILPRDDKTLKDFVAKSSAPTSLDLQKRHNFGAHDEESLESSLSEESENTKQSSSYFIQTYGCQMNVSDSEIVASILNESGFTQTKEEKDADIVLLNTCAIRDNAEKTIRNRLMNLRGERAAASREATDIDLRKRKENRFKAKTHNKGEMTRSKPNQVVGVLGCMAERLKEQLLEQEKIVDVVAGPDAYRDLPHLLRLVQGGNKKAMNIQLSLDETYADITPVRSSTNRVSAWCSIMRGCNNMCSYCIVPFTRGRERSRNLSSIEDEIRQLSDAGFKEVTLLGQNVNSYWERKGKAKMVTKKKETKRAKEARAIGDVEVEAKEMGYMIAPGFSELYKLREGDGYRFLDLLDRISQIDPEMRIRYTSPHPKDFPTPLLELHKERHNICSNLHLPAQSGSSSVLQRMRRGYSRDAYLTLIENARSIIPNVTFSSDFITGFCGETEEEHQDTLSLMEEVGFEQAYMFAYSERDRTHAAHKLEDNVPEETKQRRLREIIEVFNRRSLEKSQEEISNIHCVLVEGESKRSGRDGLAKQWTGRTDTNKRVVFMDVEEMNVKKGDYVAVQVDSANAKTLYCSPLHKTTLRDFYYNE
eukprot:g5163.t1